MGSGQQLIPPKPPPPNLFLSEFEVLFIGHFRGELQRRIKPGGGGGVKIG